MSELCETVSGLLVPESALPALPKTPATSAINPFEITFPSSRTAEGFVSRCVTRWQYYFSMTNIAREDEPDNWKATLRTSNGVVHDTQSLAYTPDCNDTKLEPYVLVKKLNDSAFRIVNKF